MTAGGADGILTRARVGGRPPPIVRALGPPLPWSMYHLIRKQSVQEIEGMLMTLILILFLSGYAFSPDIVLNKLQARCPKHTTPLHHVD